MSLFDRAPSNLVAARPWHLMHLAEHMRADERDVWLAITGANTYEPDVAVRAMLSTSGLAFAVLREDGIPVVAGGFENVRGHAWDGWMVGTDEGWSTHWRSITRAVRWLMKEMECAGATRLSITTTANRHAAASWYERSLRMQREGILRAAGAHGEDLAIYARVAEGTR